MSHQEALNLNFMIEKSFPLLTHYFPHMEGRKLMILSYIILVNFIIYFFLSNFFLEMVNIG